MKSQTLFRTLALSCILSAVVVATPSGAHAEDEYPLVYGQRPIVLTEGLSQIEAAFTAIKFDNPFVDDVFLSLNASYDYGILENLTAGVLAVPLALSPEADYGNPRVYGRYRLLSGAFDLGVNLGITLPIQSGSDLGIDVGVLARFFLNKATYLNAGIYLGISFADGTPLSLSIPVELAISFTRNIFFSVDTGFNIANLDGDSFAIPLGVGLGYTLEGATGGPMLDLYLKFGFPTAITDAGAFEVMTWQAMLGGRFYL